jgi:prepilin-type N-terminal cleavage/methylation domain-containing protein
MVVSMRQPNSQCGITLIELVLATAIGAILLTSLNSTVKLGLDAQTAGRGSNELAYQGRFALERITDKARATTPKALSTPTAGTTGDWFAPTSCTGATCLMYCRNASNKLIETTTADTTCTGTTVIASNVSAFSAQLPSGAGAVDRFAGTISVTMTDTVNNSVDLSASIRLGGGAL